MHPNQLPYRNLWTQLLDAWERNPAEPLGIWPDTYPAELEWIRDLASRTHINPPPMSQEENWRLYGLSRIVDLLITQVCSKHLQVDCFKRFMTELGCSPMEKQRFDPFYHEIVMCDNNCSDESPPMIATHLWPGYMCGQLLIVRSGVSLVCPSRIAVAGIADTSTLYWCHRRLDRPCTDLSVGWGSNSQWSTSFRRDYSIGGTHYFNADGDCTSSDDDLSAAQNLELLRHRCLVTARFNEDGDFFPYDSTHCEPEAV